MRRSQRASKVELDLTNEQTTACKQHAGPARWAYNWGLQRRQAAYRTMGTRLQALELHRELNALKPTAVPWLYEVSTCAPCVPQEALRHLDRAFAHFFRRVELKKAGKYKGQVGYPQPKTKKQGLRSFRFNEGPNIHVFSDAVHLPRLGRLRLKERGYLPTSGGQIRSATVREQAGHWYVSVLVEHEHTVPENHGPVVGVDLGLKRLATRSDGQIEENPRHLKRRLKKSKRFHRALTRQQQGSHNRKKAAQRVGALYRHVANQRANTLQRFTSRLAKTKAAVVIEDLNVAGMLKNHRLAQAIGDVGWGEFRRQLAYKAPWDGGCVIVADRWLASSKTCSGCPVGGREPDADRPEVCLP
jgi:putative transposase